MRTCLYTTNLLDGRDFYGTDRVYRTFRWLFWYENIKDLLGYDDIHILDDGSSRERLAIFDNIPNLYVHTFNKIGKTGRHEHDYPWCWRGVYFMRDLIDKGYDKIINIDTDGFILNDRLAEFVGKKNNGWWTLTPREFRFPENALNVLNRDAFPVLQEFTKVPMDTHYGKILELTLPFTEVSDQFRTFRWGQDFVEQDDTMDFYCQAHQKIRLRY